MQAIDDANWEPISVPDLLAIFREIDIPWWIGGGRALDLFLGRQTREHTDTDVLILRTDQLIVQEHLRGPWELFKTNQPGLAPCPQTEFLGPPVNCFWVRRPNSTWAFEVMLMETEGDEWVYRRERSIRGKIAEMGLMTDDGVPYLRPEIQLLYKSGPNREKDIGDLKLVLPHMSPSSTLWLLDALRTQHPEGHEWIDCIEHRRDTWTGCNSR